MAIKFDIVEREVIILNPFKNFQKDTWKIQYRTDPLTGRNTTVIPKLYEYWIKFLGSDGNLLKRLVLSSRRTCPFCPENVLSKTPKFPPEEFEEGRLVKEQAVAFPNLIGHADKSAVITLSKEHFLTLNKFTPDLIYNALVLAKDILDRWANVYSHVNYAFIIFNYLPPAGSTIIHPHIQVLARDRPATLQRILIENSIKYSWKYGRDFWSDLLRVEREKGVRYIGYTGDIDWISPFAPLRGILEIQGVAVGKSRPNELSDEDLISIADGISKILNFYHSMNVLSYNAAIIFGPLRCHLPEYSINIRIIARMGISNLNFTDSWTLPYLLWDGEAIEYPEETAKKAKKFF